MPFEQRIPGTSIQTHRPYCPGSITIGSPNVGIGSPASIAASAEISASGKASGVLESHAATKESAIDERTERQRMCGTIYTVYTKHNVFCSAHVAAMNIATVNTPDASYSGA